MTEQDQPGSGRNPSGGRNPGDGKSQTSRRAFMVGGAAAAIGAATGKADRPGRVTDGQARLLDKVTASATASASLSDVKHIVILMQENRSFDPSMKVVRTQLVSPHARVRAYARRATFAA